MANREQAFSHDDTLDREVARNFLERNSWYNIEYGGEYDLDLEVKEFKRGCDIEMISHGLYKIENNNHFRIPYRKQKYWSELETYKDKNGKDRHNKYKEWYVDYIQFLNNDLTELLWYNWRLIKEYKDNIHFEKNLIKGDFTERGSTFITIPYEIGIKKIKHYKLNNGIWQNIIN